VNENDDEKIDWGEAERKARMWDHIGEVLERMRNRNYTPVQFGRLRTGVRFVVTTYSDGHDPMDFTLLDPSTGRVRVSDNFYFPEPTECVLVGSEDDLDGGGAMLPGVVLHHAKLVMEVDGKRIEENGPELRVMRLMLHLPGTDPFNPWPE
jgi:hypothetical protein